MRLPLLVAILCLVCALPSAAQHSIGTITLEGNQKTKDQTILRELTFQVGQNIDTAEFYTKHILTSRVNLINLNLFNEVKFKYSIHENTINVSIRLQEKWYIWPIPFLEFADRNFNQWWDFDLDPSRMNYGIYYFHYNVLGRNQTLKLSLVNGYSQNLGIYYRVPNLGRRKTWNLVTEHWYKSNEEVWYKTENNKLLFYNNPGTTSIKKFKNSLSLEYRPEWRETHTFSFLRQTTEVADTLIENTLNPEFTLSDDPRFQHLAMMYQYKKDNRDNRFFPVEGNYLQVDASLNHVSEHGVYFDLTGEYNAYKPLGRGFIGSAGIKTSYRSSYRLPYNLTRMLGYKYYVRGYESYVMEGHAFGLLRTTLSKAILHKKMYHLNFIPFRHYRKLPVSLYSYLLADYGYVRNVFTEQTNTLTNKHLFGYGIGLGGVFYYDKVFRFEYSFNDLGEGGIKIHFEKAF